MKNLETEYKKEIASEVPDLWARIEAGINNLPMQNNVAPEVTNINSNVVYINTNNNVNVNKNRKRRNITVISSVLGAVACLVVAVTVVINISSVKSEKTMNAAAARGETKSEAAYDAEASYDSSDMFMAEEAYSTNDAAEAPAEAPASDYESVYEEAAECEEAVAEEYIAEEAATEDRAEESNGAAAGNNEAGAASNNVKKETDIVINAKVISTYVKGEDRFITLENSDNHELFDIFVPDADDFEALDKCADNIEITLHEYSSDEEKTFAKAMHKQVKYEYVSYRMP